MAQLLMHANRGVVGDAICYASDSRLLRPKGEPFNPKLLGPIGPTESS